MIYFIDSILWCTKNFNFNEVQFILYFSLLFVLLVSSLRGFLGGSDGKASAWNAGEQSSIPGLERFLKEANGLENYINRGAWQGGMEEMKVVGHSSDIGK